MIRAICKEKAATCSLCIEKKQKAEEGKNTQEIHNFYADCLAVGIGIVLLGRWGVIFYPV